MVYLKSLAAGIGAAIAGMLLSIVLVVIASFAWLQFEMWRMRNADTGGIGAVSAGFAEPAASVVLVVGILAFILAFRWEYRRAVGRPR